MQTISKAIVGTIAAGAMAVASASPAMARDHHRDRGGIDGGDILAGALIIGGIAAVAAAASSNNRDRYDYNYNGRYNNRYDRRGYRGGERAAVNQCVRAAERTATRYTYGGRAQVTDLRRVKYKRGGFEVKGAIAVPRNNRNYRRGGRDWDDGRFTCNVRRGQVVDLDFRGIRGL